MKNSIYIYLARLDKKGIKVLTAFDHPKKIYPTKIQNINELNLNQETTSLVSKQTYENRMHYDLHVESASSFDELKNSLKKRGYTNLPNQQFTGYAPSTFINENVLVTNNSTMLRKKSDIRQ